MRFPRDYINKIIQGDCLEVMKTFPDGCIDLVVTSPPYDKLREYGGYSFDFEGIAKELFRITKQGGVVVWVVGDATIKGSETGTSFRQALYFKNVCGFNLHDTMIYAKRDYVPLVHNRYEQAFEFMFILSKGKPRTFNPMRIPCITAGRKKSRKGQKPAENTSYSIRAREEITYAANDKMHPNIFYYYTSNNDSGSGEHPAPFPLRLAHDHIISWSNSGDIVLDPMCGSGTTCKMAKDSNRKYIGMDISGDYCKIAEERLKQEVLEFKEAQ